MKSAKLFLGLILLSLLFFSPNNARSQTLLGAKMAEGFELFNPITDATYMGNGDDPWYEIQMPFTFKFDNVNVTKMYVYGNGFISFNTYREPSAIAVPKLPTYPMIISWYAADLVTEDGMYFNLTGSAPFRVLTVEQRKARTFANGGGATFDVQIKFFETSNEIKIIWGNTAGLGGANVPGWIYFTGSLASNYINIQPNDPNTPSTFYYSNLNPNLGRWILADAPFKIPKGRVYTLKTLPTLTKVNPDGKYVLAKDYIYDDNVNRPYVLISRESTHQQIALRYKIYGPIGSDNPQTIYTALETITDLNDELINFNPQPVGNAYRVDITAAKGIAAAANGALDLKTNQNQIEGGLYEVTAVMEIIGNPALNQTVKSYFYIALDYDLEATQIQLPVLKENSLYRYGDFRVPLACRITNVGKYDIKYFDIKAQIYNLANNSLVGTVNHYWENLNDPLSRNEFIDLQLPDWTPPYVGDFYVVYTVTTSQFNPDGYLGNNVTPRIGQPKFIFGVNYEIEAAITQVLAPTSSVYANIPIRPGIRMINYGASDLTNLNVTYTVTRNNVVLQTGTQLIDGIPSGASNTLDFFFDDVFIPTQTGSYAISFKVPVNNDEIPSNNSINYAFNVIGGMTGDYTVGTGGNFATIQEAVDALYTRGVGGPVRFKLISSNYVVGFPFNTVDPAIDMSSMIPGMSATNTVTFISDENISTRGYCKIYIQSGSGIGFYFGQNIAPSNLNAPVNKATGNRKKTLANNAGYITFDGGELFTIQFIMQSPNTNFRAPFFFGNGASNITLKNLIIIDDNPTFKGQIPLTNFTAGATREFNYQPNTNITAGIYIRSTAPYDVKTGGNTYNLDTLVNKNNKIYGNVINGFGYGIVDIGMGILKKPLSDATLKFYNENNIFEKNTIQNMGFAGLFLGFTHNNTVSRNRIDNVQNTQRTAAGIIAGGKQAKSNFGFNNTNLTVNGNEISNIKAPTNVAGIHLEQSGFTFGVGSDMVFFPDKDDDFVVTNNIIRDLNAANANTNLWGINVLTTRDVLLGDDHLYYYPMLNNYTIKNTKIANNTVIVDDVNEEFFENTGEIFGIGLAQVENTHLMNNAIAVKDKLTKSTNQYKGAIFYYGMQPNAQMNHFNNNVYYILESDVDLVRFIETDNQNNIVELGSGKEFRRLDQWQAWTGQELSSVQIYDFTKDLQVYTGNPTKLRVKKNPVPVGSSLDGRGIELDFVPQDIDGNPRGYAGHRYDIGAEQFSGTPYIVDMEALNFTEPLVYRATEGFPFDDAQYIMTQVPVEVSAQFRNNGTQLQSGVKATLTITRESKANRFEDGIVVLTKEVSVNNLPAGEITNITFDLADGVPDDFVPRAYTDFDGTPFAYTNIPAHLVKMKDNVTPRYLLTIKLQYDENNWNNEISQIVRFYLQRSRFKILISTENWQTVDPSTLPNDANIVAANLNLDTLIAGMFRIGWYNDVKLENQRYDYDIFDRENWERRSTDYTLYKTMFWVDGHDRKADNSLNQLNIYKYRQLVDFLKTGNSSVGNKKNLFISSQDFVRNNQPLYGDFLNYFHAKEAAAGPTPLKGIGNYDGHGLLGTYVGRLQQFPVTETVLELNNAAKYPNNFPLPGLYDIQIVGEGVARIGMLYDTVWFDNRVYSNINKVPEELKIASVTNNAVNYNLSIVGVDWRHFSNIERTLRAMVDYAENNEGYVVPIDLLSFEVNKIGANQVALNWTTASEINSARFEVERSIGSSDIFNKIGEEIARGTSATITHYGPFVDNKVNLGNTYNYRLKMIDKDGEFKYSDSRSITLESEDGLLSLSEFEPNPAINNTKLSVTLNKTSTVSISLYDISGNLVANLFNNEVPAGTKTVDVELSNIVSGSYNAVVTINGNSFVKKITIIK